MDAKTVERWIAGRIPYARHRTRVAKALHADEQELWPDAYARAQLPGSGEDADGDVLTAYPTGDAPGAPDWQTLLTGARDRIELLDMSLWDVVSVAGVVDLLAAKAADGCQIRIVIANPEAEWTERVHNALLAQEGASADELIEQIDESRRQLKPLLSVPGIEIRELFDAEPGSLLRFDDQILFSPNLWLLDRPRAPVLHITRRQPKWVFDRFADHLEIVWTHLAERVEPDDPSWADNASDEHVAPPEARPRSDDEHVDPLLSATERERLTAMLTRWQVDPSTIADTLKHAVFSPGLAGLQSADPEMNPGVAIMIDEQRDPTIARIFQHRAAQDDQTFLADWKPESTHTRVLLDPERSEALVAYTIHITRPQAITRTYLLLASSGGQPLAWLAQPGTHVWLIPHHLATQQWAKEGAGAAADIYDRMLPLGEVTDPGLAIEASLQHIRYREN